MTPNQPNLRAAAPSVFLDAQRVLAGPLPEEISMEPIIEGVPVAYEKTVFDDGRTLFAVWACDAGVYPRVKDRRGSFMYIISGDATITDQDGTSHELTAGGVLVLPYGWVGTWHIRDTIRKVYLHTTPAPPLPRTVVPSAFLPPVQVLWAGTANEAVAFDGPDGHCAIREYAPGTYRRVADEHMADGRGPDGRASFSYVVAGAATVTDQDGTSHELTAGSVLVLPRGWAGTWHVREPIREFYVRTPSEESESEESEESGEQDPT